MKPVFSNTFNVAHNKNKSEISIAFAHIYTERNFALKDGALTNVSAQVVDDVANILMTKETASALARLLMRVVSEDTEEEK